MQPTHRRPKIHGDQNEVKDDFDTGQYPPLCSVSTAASISSGHARLPGKGREHRSRSDSTAGSSRSPTLATSIKNEILPVPPRHSLTSNTDTEPMQQSHGELFPKTGDSSLPLALEAKHSAYPPEGPTTTDTKPGLIDQHRDENDLKTANLFPTPDSPQGKRKRGQGSQSDASHRPTTLQYRPKLQGSSPLNGLNPLGPSTSSAPAPAPSTKGETETDRYGKGMEALREDKMPEGESKKDESKGDESEEGQFLSDSATSPPSLHASHSPLLESSPSTPGNVQVGFRNAGTQGENEKVLHGSTPTSSYVVTRPPKRLKLSPQSEIALDTRGSPTLDTKYHEGLETPSGSEVAILFKRFHELPIELRWMIWKFAAREVRVIEILWRKEDDQYFTNCKIPPVLHVNRESRKVGFEVLKEFKVPKSLASNTGGMDLNSVVRKRSKRIYMQYDQDLLYVSLGQYPRDGRTYAGKINDFFSQVDQEDAAKIKKIGIEPPQEPFNEILQTLAAKFSQLTVCAGVSSDPCLSHPDPNNPAQTNPATHFPAIGFREVVPESDATYISERWDPKTGSLREIDTHLTRDEFLRRTRKLKRTAKQHGIDASWIDNLELPAIEILRGNWRVADSTRQTARLAD